MKSTLEYLWDWYLAEHASNRIGKEKELIFLFAYIFILWDKLPKNEKGWKQAWNMKSTNAVWKW